MARYIVMNKTDKFLLHRTYILREQRQKVNEQMIKQSYLLQNYYEYKNFLKGSMTERWAESRLLWYE